MEDFEKKKVLIFMSREGLSHSKPRHNTNKGGEGGKEKRKKKCITWEARGHKGGGEGVIESRKKNSGQQLGR